MTAALIALREIQWMARRGAADAAPGEAADVNSATWLLDALLARFGVQPCRPDEVVSPTDRGSGAVMEPASVWTRGVGFFAPTTEQRTEWAVLRVEGQIQAVADVLVAWAARYAFASGAWSVSLFERALAVLGDTGWLLIDPRLPGGPTGTQRDAHDLWVAS